MYSVVVTSTVGPFQLPPALMPNRLWLLVPSRPTISRLPQPVSSAAWASMKGAGMPVSACTAWAASVCCCTKPAALFSGTLGVALASATAGRLLLACVVPGIGPGTKAIWRCSCRSISAVRPPGLATRWASSVRSTAPSASAGFRQWSGVSATRAASSADRLGRCSRPGCAAAATSGVPAMRRAACRAASASGWPLRSAPPAGCWMWPICRSSWRAITSDRPPGRPAVLLASWASSISVPSLLPALSISPDAWVDARMVLSSSPMNSDSNCLAASRTAPLGSLAALRLRLSRLRPSLASLTSDALGPGSDRFDKVPMVRSPRSRHSRRQRSSSPAGWPAGPAAWRPGC